MFESDHDRGGAERYVERRPTTELEGRIASRIRSAPHVPPEEIAGDLRTTWPAVIAAGEKAGFAWLYPVDGTGEAWVYRDECKHIGVRLYFDGSPCALAGDDGDESAPARDYEDVDHD